ncbi:hypothetical protein [Streptomyces platensis]|uniref:hypothetical protein n=1 Tax=Streptomyces platensis TaxID=58346 RepID=UPI001F46143B|nr:hypothetical protein [Streptomyces platensis]MCF3147853.1 hypothetical protein [Streptomyces platensis]
MKLTSWPYGQFRLTEEDPRDRAKRPGGTANLREQVNVSHCIARIFESVLPRSGPAGRRTPPQLRRGDVQIIARGLGAGACCGTLGIG